MDRLKYLCFRIITNSSSSQIGPYNLAIWVEYFKFSLKNSLSVNDSNNSKFEKVAFMGGAAHGLSVIMPIYEEMVRQGFSPIFTEKPIKDEANLLYVCSMAPPPKEIRKKTVWIPHGVGYEHPYAWNLECLKCLLPGPYWYNIYARRPFRNDQFTIVGWPKGDVLFSSNKRRIVNEIQQKYCINLPYEKTILYAPSFGLVTYGNPYASFDNSIFHILKLAHQLKMNLIIKVHPFISKSSAKAVFSKAKSLSQRMSNTSWIDKDTDCTPLFLLADVLISDHSSILREFMLTNKPSIQLTPVIAEAFKFEGVIHSSLEELPEKVVQAVNNPSESEFARKKWVNELFYRNDGNATKRAVRVIKELMQG